MTLPKNNPRALLDGWVVGSIPLEPGDLPGGHDPMHQQFEREFWGDCANTFGEETKQITYAHRMGLEIVPNLGHWPVYDLAGKSILDIGGGPASILLKTINGSGHTVLDPCLFPEWVTVRYKTLGIDHIVAPAENWEPFGAYDEAWIYNVLQHTVDPEAVLRTALRSAPIIRLFEWINMPTSIGHPHTITTEMIHEIFGPGGTVEQMNENGAVGLALHGVFEP